MTRPDRDYDDTLSRVLHSTLDPVEPAGDGLAKIQERIAEPWLKRRMSLLRTELAALAWLIIVRCEPLLDKARSGLAAFATGADRPRGAARPAAASSGRRHGAADHRAGDTGLPRWVGPTMSWLRPALVVGGAVVLVVVGVFAFGQVRSDLIAPANGSSNSTGNSHGPASRHGGSSGTSGGGRAYSGSSTVGRSPSRTAGSKAASRGGLEPSSPATSARSSPSPSPSPSMSPSPSPSSSPSPSMSPSPTASPTASTGGGGAASPTPQPTPGG